MILGKRNPSGAIGTSVFPTRAGSRSPPASFGILGLQTELSIDAVARESTHIIFRFLLRGEAALASEGKNMTVGKVDVTFPAPTVRVPISLK